MIERYFEIGRQGTTVGGEIRGGLTTFMVMAYIIFVNQPDGRLPRLNRVLLVDSPPRW